MMRFLSDDSRPLRLRSCLLIVLLLFFLLPTSVRSRTATRTPEELICLPLVVDYEGYAILAGLVVGVAAVVIYILVVRREGRRSRKRQQAYEDSGGGVEEHHRDSETRQGDIALDELDHIEASSATVAALRGRTQPGSSGGGGGSGTDETWSAGPGGSRTAAPPIDTTQVTLDAASDPATRQAIRARAAESAPEPPPR